MSAFTSIKDTAKSVLGFLSFLSGAVEEIFDNLTAISDVECPVFLMHGAKDTLIPPEHSKRLMKACKNLVTLNLVAEMDHNNFDFMKDFVPMY
jgi:fermentation-respiration switch protein FrsA (DUF1100 family)